MAPDGDLRAPGGAITVGLCGSWEHEPPCPLAPHHSSAERVGVDVRVRTLFAVEPEREEEVRWRIAQALAAGEQRGPAGGLTRWRLLGITSDAVLPHEADHARRLASAPDEAQ
jgi:hypothetical protein